MLFNDSFCGRIVVKASLENMYCFLRKWWILSFGASCMGNFSRVDFEAWCNKLAAERISARALEGKREVGGNGVWRARNHKFKYRRNWRTRLLSYLYLDLRPVWKILSSNIIVSFKPILSYRSKTNIKYHKKVENLTQIHKMSCLSVILYHGFWRPPPPDYWFPGCWYLCPLAA